MEEVQTNAQQAESEDKVNGKDESKESLVKRFQYTKEELLEISKSPCSLRPPECYKTKGELIPTIWKTNESGSNGNVKNHCIKRDRIEDKESAFKKRDPRDRVREESQDGIILSPQRRSFGTGCHIAPKLGFRTSRTEIHLSDKRDEVSHRDSIHRDAFHRDGLHRDIIHRDGFHRDSIHRDADRRLGTRLINLREEQLDWKNRDLWNDKADARKARFSTRFNNYDNRRGDRNDRFERYENREEDEPEWFTGGPTSQHDTIELRGFEEDGEHTTVRNVSSDQPSRSSSRGPSSLSNRSDSFYGSLSPKSLGHEKNERSGIETSALKPDRGFKPLNQEFDVNEILKQDHWPNPAFATSAFSSNAGVCESLYSTDNKSGTSRFAQWFPNDKQERESPIDRLFANVSVSSTKVEPKLTTVALFNSIQKCNAEKRAILGQRCQNPQPKDLFSLLKRANIDVNELMMEQSSLRVMLPDQAKSVTELEADIMKTSLDKIKDRNDVQVALNQLLSQLKKRPAKCNPMMNYSK